MKKRLVLLTVAAGAAMWSQSVLADVVALPAATQEVLQLYRGTRVHTDQGRVRIIYGAPMTPGMTAAHAAETFLDMHGAALGAPNPDLRESWTATIEDGKFTVFAYQQYLDGLPVEAGIARILVLNAPVPRVVYAAGTLTPSTPEELIAPVVDAPTAVALVRAQRLYHGLSKWSEPELAVYQGLGEWQQPVRVWKFVGEEPKLSERQKFTFFVNAVTGQVVKIRNDIMHADITGTVRALASPGVFPDSPGNPPALTNLGDVRISIFNGTSDFTDADGNIFLPHHGVEPVSLRSRLGTGFAVGRWVSVSDVANPPLEVMLNVVPPGPVNIIFNNAPTGGAASTTAQTNAFIHTNRIHHFFSSRSGDWGRIDFALRANVNIDNNCNAFYDGSSINFFTAGGGCQNSAFSTVIAHEYGHHIVNQLGLGQGGFGEGFSDTCAHLLYDRPAIGEGFGPGMSREPLVTNVQYPCMLGGIHDCGMLLSGPWWRIRQNMGTFYGSTEGLERTQQMFVSWALITTGGAGPDFVDASHPGTAIEILTINDDDGDLGNGTPDLPRICPALALHSVDCPSTAALKWVFPNDLPVFLLPDQPNTIDVNVLPMASNPTDNTGRLHYRVDGGSWVQTNMTRLAAHEYRGTIPAQTCGSIVDYYFTVNVGATPTPYPGTAPGRALFVPVAESVSTVFSDNFEEDLGWISGDPSDDAVTGHWSRGIPEATPAQPGQNRTPEGVQAWVTDYRAGAQVSDYDVDGGKTTLFSPIINLQGRNNPVISFWAWYSNDVGPVNPGTNLFEVDVTADDGASWVNAITLGPSSEETSGGWRLYRFRLNEFVPTTANVRVRFIASDYTHSIVEAAVDDFVVHSLNCGPAPAFGCYANCDGSTTEPVLNVDDFLCFLNRFANNDPWANCDGSTTEPILNVDDFLCFLNQFATGCP